MTHVIRVCVATCGAGAWITLHSTLNGGIGWTQAATYVAAFLLVTYI